MNTQDRLHALDAARAFALLLGIVLHATMSFFLVIPAQDRSQSATLAVTFYVIHMFRMTLFYWIAGFFAHMAFHRRGARAFIKDRAKRILAPMTVGWLILAPPTIAAVIWGLTRTFPNGAPKGAEAAPQGFPLIHLWFLYYLCVFYVLVLALRPVFGALRERIDRVVAAGLRSYVAPLVLAAPTVAILYFDAKWAVWFGIPTPEVGLTPQLPALVAFGTAFVFGWVVHRQVALLSVLERQWRVNLPLAVALTITCLAMAGPTPNLANPTLIQERLVYTACYALAIWCWTLGLIGASMRFFSNENVVRRYFADASYWFYLVHLPIVFTLQAALMHVPLHWSIKFPLIVTITLAVLLASYHYLVRGKLIGEFLNGRKAAHPSSVQPSGLPRAELVNVTKRYGKTVALDGTSLTVRSGELLAILGPNGAGKSTAIGLWLGTLQPDAGIATVMGASPLESQSRLGVGVMMQEVALAPMLTAREHIALTASYYDDPLSIDETIALTGIEAFANKRYGKLSAGQKRQVQFATAVCGRPRLLFLDEPTVGLDVQARETMWRTIRRLRDEGCSIVLTTHYLEEAEALADRVTVLAKGKVIAEGSVDEMRALVTRKRISCASQIAIDDIKHWPGVVDVMRDANVVHVTASDAETVVRRLLAADETLSHLEVKQASLAEAFVEITKEAA
jgi:ABC-type multidrug transport system ATPase subunit